MNKFKEMVVYYPSVEHGGMEKNLLNMFNHIAEKKKIKVTFFSTYINNKTKKNISKEINIVQYKTTKKIFFNRFSISIISFLFFYTKIKKSFSKKNTIIFSAQNSIFAIILSNILGFKVLVRNGNHPWSSLIYADNFFLGFFSFFLRLFFYNFADKIVVNSSKSKNFFKFFLLNKKKIKCISNSTILNLNLRKKKRKNFFVTAGRLTKQKNLETLINAFSIFSKKYKDYKLLILGEGTKKKDLINLAKEKKIYNKIVFKNYVNNPLDTFLSSKAYICTSLYEGLPNSIIEALNAYTPVISTNCLSGPEEILNGGKYGYLIPLKDYKTLANKMVYVVENYKLAIKKSSLGHKSLKRYNVKEITSKYLMEINDLFAK